MLLSGFKNILFDWDSFDVTFAMQYFECISRRDLSCYEYFKRTDEAERLLYFNGKAFENLGSLVENVVLPVSFFQSWLHYKYTNREKLYKE